VSLSTGAVWAGRVQNHPPLCRKKARRYGAVIGLSAGLIGPDGTSRTYSRSLQDTPVFLGCSDVDPHIPLARVHESCAVWQAVVGNAEPLLHRIEVSGVHNFRSESSLLEITSG
jgi:hypothetical protein